MAISQLFPISPVFQLDGVWCDWDRAEHRERPALRLLRADLIFGRDVISRHEFIVYGRKAMNRILQNGKGEPLAILVIELDHETEELDTLTAMVKMLRGWHEYLA